MATGTRSTWPLCQRNCQCPRTAEEVAAARLGPPSAALRSRTRSQASAPAVAARWMCTPARRPPRMMVSPWARQSCPARAPCCTAGAPVSPAPSSRPPRTRAAARTESTAPSATCASRVRRRGAKRCTRRPSPTPGTAGAATRGSSTATPKRTTHEWSSPMNGCVDGLAALRLGVGLYEPLECRWLCQRCSPRSDEFAGG
mmetsp:Transcript_86572/g.225931  ORF Transcript_86572/g.225931 Transcript_86572/m.225931 type:complete len:200 (+) Transcript_86572:1079-1678(+)